MQITIKLQPFHKTIIRHEDMVIYYALQKFITFAVCFKRPNCRWCCIPTLGLLAGTCCLWNDTTSASMCTCVLETSHNNVTPNQRNYHRGYFTVMVRIPYAPTVTLHSYLLFWVYFALCTSKLSAWARHSCWPTIHCVHIPYTMLPFVVLLIINSYSVYIIPCVTVYLL